MRNTVSAGGRAHGAGSVGPAFLVGPSSLCSQSGLQLPPAGLPGDKVSQPMVDGN